MPPTGRLPKQPAMLITKINKWWTTQMAVTVTDQSGHRLGNASSGPINGVESSSVPSTTAQSPQPLALSMSRALPVDPPAFTLSVISRMRKGVHYKGSFLQHRPWGLSRKGQTGTLGAPPTRGVRNAQNFVGGLLFRGERKAPNEFLGTPSTMGGP